MNKWRLLLFSVFGLLQITTSDRNFIDGREQCLNRSQRNTKFESRISIYEPYPVYPISPELRQLKSPELFRQVRDQELRRSSSRRYINNREQSWRERSSLQDASRQAASNQRIRELTHVPRFNERRDISRAGTYKQRDTSPVNIRREISVRNHDNQFAINTRLSASRDNYGQNNANVRLENRDTRSYGSNNLRETLRQHVPDHRFDIRREFRDSEKRKELARFANEHTMKSDTDYNKENRNNLRNTRHVRDVRNNREDFDTIARNNAVIEMYKTRNVINSLQDRESSFRTTRNSRSLSDSRIVEELRFRSARSYDRLYNNALIQDSRNREDYLEENRKVLILKENFFIRDNKLRVLRERHIQNRPDRRTFERNIRLNERSVSDKEDVRQNTIHADRRNIINNREKFAGEYRETTRRASEYSERNKNEQIAPEREISRQSRDNNDSEYTGPYRFSNNRGEFTRIRDHNLHIRNNNVEKVFQKDNTRYASNRLQNDNHENRFLRRTSQALHERIQIRNRFNNYNEIDQKDTLNMMEKNVRLDDSGRNSRNSRDIKMNERLTYERINRDRTEEEHKYASRIRSPSVQNNYIYQNTRDTLNEEFRRIKSRSFITQRTRSLNRQERHSEISNLDASKNEESQRSRTRDSQDNSRPQTTYTSRMPINGVPRNNEIQNFRYNIDADSRRIRSRAMKERALTRQTMNALIRNNILNSRDTLDDYLHRFRTRSLEERYSIQENRDETRTLNIRDNEKSRQWRSRNTQTKRSIELQEDASKIHSTNEHTRNDVRNSRNNVDKQLQRERTRPQSIQERTYRQQASDLSIRNTPKEDLQSRKSHTMQESHTILSMKRNRILITNANDELRGHRSRSMHERRITKRQIFDNSIVRSISLPSNVIQHSRYNVEESSRIRSRNVQERLTIRTTGVKNLMDNDESRQTRSRSSERLLDSRLTRNVREVRQSNENRQARYVDMRRVTPLILENRSTTAYNDYIRSVPITDKQSENYIYEMKWQYLFYALQVIYLCSLFTKMSKEESKRKFRITSWIAPVDYLKID